MGSSFANTYLNSLLVFVLIENMHGNALNMDKKVPLSKISIAPIVRQSQSLQLCAVMTINNLLQACTEDEAYENESVTEALMLCGGNLLRLKKDAQPIAIAAAELNHIGDELIFREPALLQDHATSQENSQGNTCLKAPIVLN